MRICNPRQRAVLMSAAVTLLALAVMPISASSQTPDSAWDAPRVLELIERARARRLVPAQDTLLHNYTAQAEGFVYFYLDRRDTNETTLVKTDQIALELYWAAPDLTSQRIVGLRDESRLPNRMHYHLDHLTVVQNGFGDVIRLGDGDEVRDVPHPAAPGSGATYAFRLADSLTITLQSSATPIRVYEVEVKPRSNRVSALVGSIFIDRATADIVRMTFTFTPASYVDPRLDYISVSLENALWEGRYWLPHQQTLQIRRQVPYFDFAASAIIHGRMRVTDYTFNDSLPRSAFYGGPVTAVPEAERERFPFERGLYDDLNDAGLQPPPDLATVRAQAAELLGTSRLSGLPRLRLGLASASAALRYNRAEGVAIGAGVAYTPTTLWRADGALGFAFGPERVFASLALRRQLDNGAISARVALRDMRDIGVRPAVPGVINTLAAAVLGRDYLDPFYADGVQLSLRRSLNDSWWWEAAAGGERHRSASLAQSTAIFDDSAAFRPVRAIETGNFGFVRLTLDRPVTDARAHALGLNSSLVVGAYDGAALARVTADALLRRASADHSRDLRVRAAGGANLTDAPAHFGFYIGGINTLPGYEHRMFAGTAFMLIDAELRQSVWDPWVGVRALAAAGWTGGRIADVPSGVPLPNSPGSGVSLGAGLSLFWDVLRVDLARGLTAAGQWQVLLSFHPDFWDIS